MAAQAPLPVEAPIIKIRLHPDEAWVTRVGQVKVPGPGVHRLLVADLPPGLTMDDLRVGAKGPQGSSLGDVSLGAEIRKVTETPEYQALKKAWEAARDKEEGLEAEGEALAQELAFLRGLQAAHDKELSQRLTFTLPAAGSVVELSKGIQTRLGELLTRNRRRAHEQEKAKEETRRLELDLAQRASGRSASPVRAVVEVSTRGAGAVEVELTYRTRKAAWEPAYEARLAEGGKVDLILFATVRQATGEDWTGVQLEVTNARASRSLTLAGFKGPQVVGYSEFEPDQAGKRKRSNKAEAVVEVVASQLDAPSPMAQNTYILDAESQDARPQEAAPAEEAQGLASTWTLEGRKDVPADGDAHRFRLLSREVEPTLALVAVPRLDPTVFRVARFQVPAGIPLFPGSPVVHYAGTQRVGQAPLEMPAPGLPLQLGFGPFRGVRVALQRVDAKKELVGTFTKDTQWTLRERFDLTNDTDTPWEIELQDRELKAANDKVKISLMPGTTPSQDGPFPGVRSWKVNLAPKATGSVNLATQIRMPQGGFVSGLGNLHLPE
jgi:uncharacterized protein (TIGR02231 family)